MTSLLKGRQPDRRKVLKTLSARKQLFLCCSRTCQLRCDYCVANMSKPGAQHRYSLCADLGVPSYLELLAPILRAHGPLMIWLGGPGEPLIEPVFPGLCAGLLEQGQRVHVTTNGLVHQPLLELQQRFQEGLSCDLTFHAGPLTVKRRRRVLKHARDLASIGLLRNVVVPLSPRALRTAPELIADLSELRALGPRILLRRLSHRDAERRYPESYTTSECEQIQRILEAVAGATMWPASPPHLLPLLGVPLELRGACCTAPSVILNIGMDGGLWNCFAQPFDPSAQGHLRAGYDLERLFAADAVPCGYDECSCRLLGIEHCLQLHDVTIEAYCARAHQERGDEASARAILGS